jgi:hypothetical protein
MKKELTSILLLLLLTPFICCENAGTSSLKLKNPATPVSGIAITEEKIYIDVGMVTKVDFTISPEDATTKSVNWSIENSEIAAINTNGNLIGVSYGETTITVTTDDGGYTDTCLVNVTEFHTLSFDPNGGTGTMESIDVAQGQTITLPENTFESNSIDHGFKGWAESITGNVAYNDQAEFTMGDSDATVYAIWNNLWIKQTEPGEKNWSGISLSGDGSTIAACVYGGYIFVSTNSGETWTECESTRNWSNISVSANGSVIAACVNLGHIYISTNSGATWYDYENTKNWTGIDLSADGSIIAVCAENDFIYVSTDTGTSWNSRASSKHWTDISMSADGSLIAASSRKPIAVPMVGYIHVSTDTGVNWTTNSESSGNKNWISIDVSSDGSTIAAGAENSAPTEKIHISKDNGVNWNSKGPTDEIYSQKGWKDISISADGSKFLALGEYFKDNYWFTSADGFESWTSRKYSSDGNIVSGVEISDDGKTMVMFTNDTLFHDGFIYIYEAN